MSTLADDMEYMKAKIAVLAEHTGFLENEIEPLKEDRTKTVKSVPEVQSSTSNGPSISASAPKET
eukprot:CAMPEP_0194157598 /NCGR_PEP_ID=MMETSP0152-20130528/72618_1 /TAXON_ID=1049557 /ORGANISM="Thalassiothrix antarctica, Strain L6-D1" /LENGTH=64 /DNA_ID=CAMNT_0038866107 /DNA_START=184 /DNA_END=374 /DNA_ORIENTATION=+